MSMNTTPEAPSSAKPGNSRHCKIPEMAAVIRMPPNSVRLPYFSSMGGPMTKSNSMLLRK